MSAFARRRARLAETGRGPELAPAVRGRIERLRALIARPGTEGEGAAARFALDRLLDRHAPAVALESITLDGGYLHRGRTVWIGSSPLDRDVMLTRLRPGPGTMRAGFCLHAVEVRHSDGSFTPALLQRRIGLLAFGRTDVLAGETIEIRCHAESPGLLRVVIELEEGRASRVVRALFAERNH